MHIKQIYTNCLAHAAYYIEDGKEAAVIDPLRDPEPYLKLAHSRGAHIKYVIETHFHADFVSGHIDLANVSGAMIVFGPDAEPGYRAHIGKDGELLPLGDAQIKLLHTPGHTVESTCYLLLAKDGAKRALFSGDTLFVGDVGRPDLLSGNLPKETLAAMLYDSIKNKIKTLPDDVVVYPGHGAGSACGKNIGNSSFSTIGEERAGNYAMLIDGKDEFIKAVISDLPSIPGYFFKDAGMNKNGAGPFAQILSSGTKPLSVDEVLDFQGKGHIVLDTRDPLLFASGFIPGAINIGLNGDFAVWVGTLIDPDATIVLVCDQDKEAEAVERLARIGYDQVDGFLFGGMGAWRTKELVCDTIAVVRGIEYKVIVNNEDNELLDVRNRREAAHNRIAGSIHIPLDKLRAEVHSLDKGKKWLVYCAGGYRSMIAASFMKALGYHDVASVEGGINQIAAIIPELLETGLETE